MFQTKTKWFGNNVLEACMLNASWCMLLALYIFINNLILFVTQLFTNALQGIINASKYLIMHESEPLFLILKTHFQL